jgi:hypothetical protein
MPAVGWLADLAVANWELAVLYPIATLFLLCLYRHETGIPVAIGALLVPPVTVLGFALAYWIHVRLAVTMLQALGGLCAALVPLLLLYDALVTGRRSPSRPGPPSRDG